MKSMLKYAVILGVVATCQPKTIKEWLERVVIGHAGKPAILALSKIKVHACVATYIYFGTTFSCPIYTTVLQAIRELKDPMQDRVPVRVNALDPRCSILPRFHNLAWLILTGAFVEYVMLNSHLRSCLLTTRLCDI